MSSQMLLLTSLQQPWNRLRQLDLTSLEFDTRERVYFKLGYSAMHEQEGTIQLFAAAKCPKWKFCCSK